MSGITRNPYDDAFYEMPLFFLSGDPVDEIGELILTYVPNAEFFAYQDALQEVMMREQIAAEMLLNSLIEGGIL